MKTNELVEVSNNVRVVIDKEGTTLYYIYPPLSLTKKNNDFYIINKPTKYFDKIKLLYKIIKDLFWK
jgi:hypothetical protein